MDLHFEYIKPGQRDWLKEMNETLAGVDLWHKQVDSTLMNGAAGYGGGDIWYNKSFFVASIDGWIKLKGSGILVDFMTNPFQSVVDWKGVVPINRYLPITAQTAVASGKADRSAINVGLDENGPVCCWRTPLFNDNFDVNATYGISVHLPFFGSAEFLKL
ncbi:MAG: hypothetical protein ACI31O_03635 [Limosilactobacillus vaginalis]|uniref:hypothetical protein n=1 Tax=Limosilactobacillus vaginalis TaxID=1633 RepID=UPI003F092DEF